MRRRKINDEQLTWLYNHYNDDGKTAKMLAEELTKMVSKDAEKEIKRLKGILVMVDDPVFYQHISREIKFYEENMVITEADIRRYKIRYGMPDKSMTHISMQNRKKADITNLIKWKSKAITVDAIQDFLSSINDEESIIVKAKNTNQMNTFKTMIYKWNRSHGIRKSIFFCASYDRKNMLIRIQPRRNRG